MDDDAKSVEKGCDDCEADARYAERKRADSLDGWTEEIKRVTRDE